MKRILTCILVAVILLAQVAHADSLDTNRKKLHGQRNRLNGKVDHLLKQIKENYIKNVAALAGRAAAQEAEDVQKLALEALKQLAPDDPRLAEVEAGKKAAVPGRPVKVKDLDKAKQAMTKKQIELADSCFKAGLIGTAYDIALDAFKAFPDQKDLRKLFGYSKQGDRWFRSYEMQRYKKGENWHQKLGWIKRKHQAIYDAGKYLIGRETTTVEGADKHHNKWTNPWVIETEHFIVKSNMPLKEVVALVTRIEAFYRKFFRYYVGYFNFGKRGAMRSLFRMENAKKLTIHYWATKDDYVAHATGIMSGANMGLLAASQGFYSRSVGTSQFWHSPQGNDTTLYHEVTHQILGEYGVRQRKDRPIWVVEGAAVNSECVNNEGPFDVTFDPFDNIRLQFVKKKCPTKSIFQFMGISRDQFHGGERLMNYGFCGAVVTFFTAYKDGIYREDFVDYLRDIYFEKVDGFKVGIDRYLQQPRAKLQKEFEEFIESIPKKEYYDRIM